MTIIIEILFFGGSVAYTLAELIRYKNEWNPHKHLNKIYELIKWRDLFYSKLQKKFTKWI